MEKNRHSIKFNSTAGKYRLSALVFILFSSLMVMFFSGCTAKGHRIRADKTAYGIIQKKQTEVLGNADNFNIERPGDILRRRLQIDQDLIVSGNQSLGTDALDKIDHWPEKNYPKATESSAVKVEVPENREPLVVGFSQALEIAAENSFDYQSQKENLFRSALTLDLTRNDYGLKTDLSGESKLSTDKTRDTGSVEGYEHSGDLSLSKTFRDGTRLAASLAVDLVSLLTQSRTSSYGLSGDASISIPLLRGSKTYIHSENLTQAERDVVYAVYNFERYKKTFAVNIASNYLNVLRQLDQRYNSSENYKILIASARRSRRLADAGRLDEIEVDQAVQRELSARERWISAMEQYKNRIDSFKQLLGLPPDALIELDRSELDKLVAYVDSEIITEAGIEEMSETGKKIPPADTPIELTQPDKSHTGPLELDEKHAMELGLKNRLDLKVSEGKVYDAQRDVIVKADALGTELTLLGQARAGSSRSLTMADMENGRLNPDMGIYSAVLSLDLPIERTRERNAYRESYISLERAVRDFQSLEDDIKLSIRQRLRSMSEAREGLKIQKKAVSVAEKREKSTSLFFEAGRAQIRDVLEAQEALLTARNALTSAVIEYRLAELEFQRDAGLLKIDQNGLLQEYSPEDNDNAN